MSLRGRISRGRSTYQQSIWHASSPEPIVSPEHKVILLGVAGVGKTSFFLRVRDDVFVAPESTCTPVDYLVKRVKVSSSDDAALKIILYDTAGGERFRTLTSNFYQNAHAAVLMFSLDDCYSFDRMELEVENARPFVDQDFVWAVVGNKSDLQRDAQISDLKIQAFCNMLDTNLCLYTSVKTGENVEQVLEAVARQLYRVRYGSISVSVGSGGETVHLIAANSEEAAKPVRKRGCKSWQCDVQ